MNEEKNNRASEDRANKELQRQEQILDLYDKALSSTNQDWSELKPVDTKGSWMAWLGLSPCMESQVETQKLSQGDKTDTSFWLNYDIEISLSPQLLAPDRYEAAKKILHALRIAIAKKKAKLKMFERLQRIKQREVIKIQTHWRMHCASALRTQAEEEQQDAEKESKLFDKFLASLLDGFQMLRWSHKKKTLVPCTLRVDGQNYEHFLFQQNAVRVKRYYFHDIESVSKGYVSPFLKQYVESTDSEKTLSIYFRDRRRGGKRKSVDLVFIGNTGTAVNKSKFPGRQRNTKSASDEFENKGDQDHKARMDRNRFYNNLKLLINELESDDAFFFGSTGAYCRVGTSIFERWERVTMIDPNWEPVDTQRLLLEYRVSQAKPNDDTTNRKKKGMYKPWPLSEKHKPQNAEPFNVIYRWSRTQKKDNRTRQYAACWYSETVEIDYGDYADMLEVSQKWFKNPMRKEVFMLQRCKLVNSSGREVVAEEHLLNSELPSVELPPDMYWKPEFIHERKHSMRNPYSQKGRLGSPGHRPAQVKLVEMKEHYEKEVRRLWGTIGVTGWRNCVTGEFDFEDVDWRKLIKMAREKKLENGVLDTVATYAADELENAMNTYEDTPMVISSTNANIEDSHEAQQQRKKKKSSHDALVHCRITLLKRLWSIQGVPTEEIHKKGRMWLTRRKQTYNTAQKAAFTKSMLTSPPLSKDEVLKEAKIENIAKRTGIHVRRDGKTSGSGPRVLPGCKIELRVLELNKRKPYSLPLGLRVTRFRDPGEGFRVTSRKREVSIIATVGLRVVGVEANVLASIDSAWQVRTIQKGDILVAVNGRTGSSIPELVKLTQLGKTPRILTFYRIDDPSTMSLSVNYDDEGQESSSSEDKKDNDGNAGTSIDNEDEYDFAEHVILL